MRPCAAFPTAISRRCSIAAFVSLTTLSISAQSSVSVDDVLARMGAYLVEYESQLSSVVAEESFSQRVDYPRSMSTFRSVTRRLESEVGFIRLPGNAEWLGFRDVRKVDNRTVRTKGLTVGDVLASGKDVVTQARVIANASAHHHLGLPRTVNVPTAALDVIHPSHFGAVQFKLDEPDTIRGKRMVVLNFLETGRPTMVREPSGEYLVSSGRVWVEAGTGVVWRIDWTYQAEKRRAGVPPPRLQVDFAPNAELGIMVPTVMTEVFSVPTTASRGEGRATYRNFRRFGTAARIVPQS
jgi:hypothetical protein